MHSWFSDNFRLCKKLSLKISPAGVSRFYLSTILFVTSFHLTTNLVFPNFFSVRAVEKQSKLFIGPKLKKSCFGPIFFFSFLTAKTEKNSCVKLGETRLVVWWFDVTAEFLKVCILDWFWIGSMYIFFVIFYKNQRNM